MREGEATARLPETPVRGGDVVPACDATIVDVGVARIRRSLLCQRILSLDSSLALQVPTTDGCRPLFDCLY